MIIAQNLLATAYYNKEEQMLISIYKGRADIPLALEHIERIIVFLKKNNSVLKSVVDVSEVHGSFAKILGYVKDSYHPIAIETGLQSEVYVISEDLIIKNLGIKLKDLAILSNLKSKLFTDRKKAIDWLKRDF